MKIAKPSIHVSDSIEFKSINTGGNSAGNGGEGSFKGYVVNAPTLNFDPSNTANGASVHVSTGDHVDQKAYWDAGKASAEAEKWSKAYANANSNGDQKSYSGHDTSKVYANTTATQDNSLWVDQHQAVMAGIGGSGGSGNLAMGGNVDFQFDTSI
ncbi:hypothetical protein SAMN05444159_0673 [Bradyrhizobium lablabi]|uniref:Uncharacterized protein n=1 Tax=Bradyrhizobium lablabi TaxID=722472 RepID=A0A1M6JGH9_9BRAD|nr:hypothetical protein [Bradyrhizobium lablabi]SHJ45828.1 hypothetical protein SAMN05444159_0673 [Bradyrhizobium lablabi]